MISHTKGTSDFSLDSLQEAADQVGQLSNMATLPPNPSAATSEDDGAQGEDIDATPEQLQKLRAVMDSDTTSAIVEGLAQADPQAIMQKEKEENDRAAAESAKDLDDDYGSRRQAALWRRRRRSRVTMATRWCPWSRTSSIWTS